jgi:hypothetical protein
MNRETKKYTPKAPLHSFQRKVYRMKKARLKIAVHHSHSTQVSLHARIFVKDSCMWLCRSSRAVDNVYNSVYNSFIAVMFICFRQFFVMLPPVDYL